jgi:hypothetical protein
MNGFNKYTGSQEPVPGLNSDLLLDQLKYFTFKLQNIVFTEVLLTILCHSCREYTFANVIGVDYIYSKLQNFGKMINGVKIFHIFQIFQIFRYLLLDKIWGCRRITALHRG